LKTPEGVKAMLATLTSKPKVTNAQIEAYCRRAGRPCTSAASLADLLKTL
jgi:hypothetical protein